MIDFGKIKEVDSEVYDLILKEYDRQNSELEMIASENRPSEAVLMAQASYHTLKYAEGYPKARYYAGCEVIDATEQLAIDRACELFHCKYANVQPHSGASANLAVQFALLEPGDTILGMSLNSGGHLTHGAKPTLSGKYFNAVQYDVSPYTYLLDYEAIRLLALEYKPKLIIAGASAYPREIDFKKFREIADEVGAYLMVDMAHIAGLVATGLHQSPLEYADVVTSTSHKTLRGPRSGLILTNSEEMIKKINKAVFPGVQGGPLENIIAAKAVCFKEALQPSFKEYMQKVVNNCKVLAEELMNKGVKLLTNGTDNHLILIDLREKDITGQELENRLKEVGIVTNKNAVPYDTKNKKTTSGLRMGTAAVTSRGLGEDEMKIIADIVAKCLVSKEEYHSLVEELKQTVADICAKYPLYGE